MRLFLIGFMGSGKTTYGIELAKYIKYSFIDLDNYIEQRTQKCIVEIFEKEGENIFRHYETLYLKEIINNFKDAVIATGGGTPCFNNNMNTMKNNGTTIYLKTNPEELFLRIANTAHTRPLIKNVSKNELQNWIKEKLKEREVYYNRAHYIVDTKLYTVNDFFTFLKNNKVIN